MKFFLSGLGNSYYNLSSISEAVITGDEFGFDGALMTDHYMMGGMQSMRRGRESKLGSNDMRRMRERANSTLETWVTLSYLAGKTEQIKLGTLVTPIPFRPPAIFAKMLSTLDILSKGRVVLGVGAGWSQPEFEGYSEWNEPKVRVDKTKEGLELMIKLWTQDTVTFKGKHYETKDAVLEPKPVQKPYPQLLFGGRGDRMLRLAGRYADICYIMSPMQSPGVYEEGKKKVLTAAKRANRVDKVAFMSSAPRTMGSQAPYDSEEYIKKIEAAVETGSSYYLTTFPRDTYIESMRRFVKEVMPSFK